MVSFKKIYQEKNINLVFRISLILKGIFSGLEIVSGLTLFFVSQSVIVKFVGWMTQGELLEDPKDFLSNYFLKGAQILTISSQHFAALYLLFHGIVKLFLIIMLYKKKLFAYPLSMLVFVFFIIYQLDRYYYTHSIGLLILTLFDMFIIYLTWHEYRYMKKNNQAIVQN